MKKYVYGNLGKASRIDGKNTVLDNKNMNAHILIHIITVLHGTNTDFKVFPY